MKKQWSFDGALAPLFDRLTDENPKVHAENKVFVTLNKQELLDSIRQEVENLLNTRCSLSLQEYKALKPDHRVYGIPELFGLSDFSAIDGENKTTWYKSAQLIENAIRIFEPRLIDVSVRIRNFDTNTQLLYVDIAGKYKIGKCIEHITFPISMQNAMLSESQ